MQRHRKERCSIGRSPTGEFRNGVQKGEGEVRGRVLETVRIRGASDAVDGAKTTTAGAQTTEERTTVSSKALVKAGVGEVLSQK